MPEQFLICFNTSDPKVVHGALAYWELTEDGLWTYPVKAIAAYWGLEVWETSAKIQECAPAYIPGLRCSECLEPSMATSRTALVENLKRSSFRCLTCIRAEQDARAHALKAQQSEKLVRKQADEQEQKKIWERETSPSEPFAYWSLSLADTVRAFALYNCARVDNNFEITQLQVPPLMPDELGVAALLKRLRNLRVLEFGRKTPVTAFESGEKPGTFSYYPTQVTWRFARAADELASKDLGQVLGEYIDQTTNPVDLWTGVSELWWEIGRAECRRYFDEKLNEYSLYANEGNALDGAINHALLHFSIPQVRNLIWRVAKDTAAYSARVDVFRPQAINSIPGALTRKVDRAIVDGWEIKPFFLKWEEEECALTTSLFDRALGSGKQGYGNLSGKLITERVGPSVST
jgi:hypothetical protein